MRFLHGISLDNKEKLATRDGFGCALVEIGEKNESVVALTADLSESTRVLDFAEKFPERFIEMGVAEQNLAGVAAGLAHSGKIPFMASYAVFSPGRNWDQIRVSICYSNANVKIVGAHAGLTVGPDGATHQALEDIAIMRVLPHMRVVVPSDYHEAMRATHALASIHGPVYLRLGREKWPIITSPKTPFELGKALSVCAGDDVTVIACGVMVYQAIQAAKELEDKISVNILNMHTVKPLDVKAIIEAAKQTGVIVTAEEHQVNAGLGSAVAEVVAEHYPVPVFRIGVADSFGESGEPKELLNHYGLGVETLIKVIEHAVEKKHAR